MSALASVFLTVHIVTAIVAFGPSFAFPLISRMAAGEPASGLFAARLIHTVERRLILPAALTMPISGGLVVWAEGLDLLSTRWLLVAIIFYISAITFSVLIQVPTVARMVEVLESMNPAPAPVLTAGPGAALAMTAAEVQRPAPARDLRLEMARLAARANAGGIVLSMLIVIIVALMVTKPF